MNYTRTDTNEASRPSSVICYGAFTIQHSTLGNFELSGRIARGPYRGQFYNVIANDDFSDVELWPGWVHVQLRDGSGLIEREIRMEDLCTEQELAATTDQPKREKISSANGKQPSDTTRSRKSKSS